jgi:hypothetical protein
LAERAALLAEVERRLGDRRLVWAGLRGDDIEPLADLPQLHASFSIIGAYNRRGGITSVAYEDLTGVRVDPETWDIDEHLRDEATREFRHGLLQALGSTSALLPYRPSQFLSAVHFARLDQCVNLGLFGAQQSAFEHKPWVESAVAAMGISRIPWTYVADEEQLKARDVMSAGKVVLRRSRTSGGQGFTLVNGPDELAAAWPEVDEAFTSVAPYLEGGLPLNVGATVWRDGVTVHHPSVQLIGIESCVTRRFGYCGNDFGLVRDLEPAIVDQIEASTVLIGKWLQTQGYLGSFGVDYLVHEGKPLFTEVNPRFQGSTHASCRLSIQSGEACLMLEHLAAWLGIPCPGAEPLRSRVAHARDLTNLVVHWIGDETRALDAHKLVDDMQLTDPGIRADVLVPEGVVSDPGSLAARLSLQRSVTTSGFDIDDVLDRQIGQWQRGAAQPAEVCA